MAEGVDGLLRDKTRPPGRAPVTSERVAEVVRLCQTEPPHEATHWTVRAMAKACGLAVSTVQEIWKAHGLAPHRWRAFKLSTDPAFVAKLHDVVGLYVDPGLFPQLERRLEQVAVQPRRGIEANQRGRRVHAFAPAVAHQPADHGAVLLLHPGLVVLAIRPGPGHLQPLAPAPGHHELVHEGAVVVEVHAQQGKGEQRSRLLEGRDHQAALPQQHRHTLGPARGDVGQHHGLHEAAGRRRAGMSHEVDLGIARRRIAPIAEGADRHRAPHRRAQPGTPAQATAGDDAHLRQQAVHRRYADGQQLAAKFGVQIEPAVPLQRRQQHGNQRHQTLRAEAVGCLPQHHQCVPDRTTVADGSPLGWRLRRAAREHPDRMLTMVAADGDELVQDSLLAGPVARTIATDDRPHQFRPRRHAELPRHPPPPNQDGDGGTTQPEAAILSGNIQREAMRGPVPDVA